MSRALMAQVAITRTVLLICESMLCFELPLSGNMFDVQKHNNLNILLIHSLILL